MCVYECVVAILSSGESRVENKFELTFEDEKEGREEKWTNADVFLGRRAPGKR